MKILINVTPVMFSLTTGWSRKNRTNFNAL